MAIEGLALKLLAEAVRQPYTKIATMPAWLRPAHSMIVERFAETLKPTQIAAEVGVHAVYLVTVFRRKFGVTIGEFVRQLRIERPCAELVKEDLSLAAIVFAGRLRRSEPFLKSFQTADGYDT